MAMGPSELMEVIGQYTGPIFQIVGFVFQVLAVIGVVYWLYVMWKFNTKLIISEMGKNRKVINSQVRAKEFTEKKTKIPKLRTFGILGFGGEVIEKPPAECITPFKSRITNRMYQFIKKDGIYYPVQNYVLGKKDIVDGEEIFTLEGSGLEVNRDFNAEDAILNRLENAAMKYRNKDQRNQMYLSYGIMIMCIIASGLIMVYTINKFGRLTAAIEALKEPIKAGVENAMSTKIGPG